MNVPDTWRAAHCVQCWRTPEACEDCGCHLDPRKETG